MGIRYIRRGNTTFPEKIEAMRGACARLVEGKLVSILHKGPGEGGLVRIAKSIASTSPFDEHGRTAEGVITIPIGAGEHYTGPGGVEIEGI